jgi:hypothetical protein
MKTIWGDIMMRPYFNRLSYGRVRRQVKGWIGPKMEALLMILFGAMAVAGIGLYLLAMVILFWMLVG